MTIQEVIKKIDRYLKKDNVASYRRCSKQGRFGSHHAPLSIAPKCLSLCL